MNATYSLGDIIGYIWGKMSERISIPVVNARDKQTYFGALDYKTKEFLTHTANKGNSENTIVFLEYLRSQRPGAKLLIIWDGASYHRSQQIKDYLDSLNTNLDKEEWLITCVRVAFRILLAKVLQTHGQKCYNSKPQLQIEGLSLRNT